MAGSGEGDFMDKYWFKPKNYGWGFGWPITWQGWLSLLVLLLFIGIFAFVDGIFFSDGSIKSALRFIMDIVIITTLYCLVFRNRVEGGLKWRWGHEQSSK